MGAYRELLLDEGREFELVHHYTLDAKGRLSFPTRYREEFRDGIWITTGADGSLDLWTAEGYREQKRSVARLPTGSREARRLRALAMDVHQVAMDGQHRVTLPHDLRTRMHLDREIVVKGNIDHVQVWDRGAYEDFMAEARAAEHDSEYDV